MLNEEWAVEWTFILFGGQKEKPLLNDSRLSFS